MQEQIALQVLGEGNVHLDLEQNDFVEGEILDGSGAAPPTSTTPAEPAVPKGRRTSVLIVHGNKACCLYLIVLETW